MGAIGYLMKGSGIEELLSENGICKKGTANKVMSGNDYYKMIRTHSLICEAVTGLLWEQFEQCLQDESQLYGLNDNLGRLLHAISTKDSSTCRDTCEILTYDLTLVLPSWNEYTESLGVTAQYWIMYIEMVQILKRYIPAERTGLWNKHLKGVRNMMPFIAAVKHTKCMSCLPLYLKEMEDLPKTHPEVHEASQMGNFTVALQKEVSMGYGQTLPLSRLTIKKERQHFLKV